MFWIWTSDSDCPTCIKVRFELEATEIWPMWRSLKWSSFRLVKWKLKGPWESLLYHMVFCWSKHVKDYFPEADTVNGYFAKADTWKNILLKRTQVKGCFTKVST